MKSIPWPKLVAAAKTARKRAHAPYSKYLVGAAVLSDDGRIFGGCNVENATYGATICAERTAVVKMVSEGAKRLVAVVVVTEGESPASPCGVCRQVLCEVADDVPVRMVALDPKGRVRATRETTLDALLPDAFRGDRVLDNLKKKTRA